MGKVFIQNPCYKTATNIAEYIIILIYFFKYKAANADKLYT